MGQLRKIIYSSFINKKNDRGRKQMEEDSNTTKDKEFGDLPGKCDNVIIDGRHSLICHWKWNSDMGGILGDQIMFIVTTKLYGEGKCRKTNDIQYIICPRKTKPKHSILIDVDQVKEWAYSGKQHCAVFTILQQSEVLFSMEFFGFANRIDTTATFGEDCIITHKEARNVDPGAYYFTKQYIVKLDSLRQRILEPDEIKREVMSHFEMGRDYYIHDSILRVSNPHYLSSFIGQNITKEMREDSLALATDMMDVYRELILNKKKLDRNVIDETRLTKDFLRTIYVKKLDNLELQRYATILCCCLAAYNGVFRSMMLYCENMICVILCNRNIDVHACTKNGSGRCDIMKHCTSLEIFIEAMEKVKPLIESKKQLFGGIKSIEKDYKNLMEPVIEMFKEKDENQMKIDEDNEYIV